jgi:hypothetical protein
MNKIIILLMKKIIVLAFALLSMSCMAQVNIGIGHFGPSPASDTVAAGSSETYDVWIKNYGPGVLNDQVGIHTGVWDSLSTGIDSINYFSAGNLLINPGDSALVTLTANYNVDSSNYRYGIDVIVIWPYAPSAMTADSLQFTVYIMDVTGIGNLDVNNLIKFYPNPSSEFISIDNSTGVSIELVNIYDLSGKLVSASKGETLINIQNLSAGMYQTDIILTDKKHYKFKIIKQKKATE